MKRRELVTALGAAAVLMTMISGFAWVKWGAADRAALLEQRAGKIGDMNLQRRFMEPTLAEVEFARMQRNVSRYLADLARQHQMRGDVGTALLLALESLPDSAGNKPRVTEQLTVAVEGGTDGIDRVYVPESELQLDAAWRALRERHMLIGQEYAVNSAAFSPDSKRIVTASTDKTARLWDAETGQLIGEPLIGHTDRLTSASFSADGKHILTASLDKSARLWDTGTGRQMGTPFNCEDRIMGAAFSPDDTRMITASVDGTARFWDVASGRQIGTPLAGHAGIVNSAAFSPDGKHVVTASADGTARLWDSAADRQMGTPLLGHAGVVSSASFSPDGMRIVTASGDETARLWDAGTGRQIGVLLCHDGFVSSGAFSRMRLRHVTGNCGLPRSMA